MALRQSGAWPWASASGRLVVNSQGGWELVRGSRQERHRPIGGLRTTSGGHGSSCFAGAKRRQGLAGGGGAQATASMWRSIVCTRDSAKGSRDPGPHTWDTPGYSSWVASPVVMDAHHGWRCSARTTLQLRRAECINRFELHHFDTLKLFKVEYNFKIDQKESCR